MFGAKQRIIVSGGTLGRASRYHDARGCPLFVPEAGVGEYTCVVAVSPTGQVADLVSVSEYFADAVFESDEAGEAAQEWITREWHAERYRFAGWARPGSRRANHPIWKFAARGRLVCGLNEDTRVCVQAATRMPSVVFV